MHLEDIRNQINYLKSKLKKAEYIISDTVEELEKLEQEVSASEYEENKKANQMAV